MVRAISLALILICKLNAQKREKRVCKQGEEGSAEKEKQTETHETKTQSTSLVYTLWISKNRRHAWNRASITIVNTFREPNRLIWCHDQPRDTLKCKNSISSANKFQWLLNRDLSPQNAAHLSMKSCVFGWNWDGCCVFWRKWITFDLNEEE